MADTEIAVTPTSATTDYAALLRQRRELDERLGDLREQALIDFKQRILAEAQELEVDVATLFAAGKPRRVSKPARIAFRDPLDPTKTWSGRGRPPQWLQEYLDAGRDKDEFVIA